MSIPIDPVQQSDPPRGWIGDLALTGFLLGPHGRSLTGQVLTVCGGASL